MSEQEQKQEDGKALEEEQKEQKEENLPLPVNQADQIE